MNMLKSLSHFVLASIAAAVVTATPATAQDSPWSSYAAKFMCNAQNANDIVAVFGLYRTVVNIHNPHYLHDMLDLPVPLIFYKKAVLTKPQGEIPFPPSCHQLEFLSADTGLAVTCNNIKTLLALAGLPVTGLIEGFLVIEVPPQPASQPQAPPLDVVTVYTARQRKGTDADVRRYDVQTLDVERVPSTTIIGDPTLNLCD